MDHLALIAFLEYMVFIGQCVNLYKVDAMTVDAGIIQKTMDVWTY